MQCQHVTGLTSRANGPIRLYIGLVERRPNILEKLPILFRIVVAADIRAEASSVLPAGRKVSLMWRTADFVA